MISLLKKKEKKKEKKKPIFDALVVLEWDRFLNLNIYVGIVAI